MNLLLFGFENSGKIHFGKLLALQMERPFIEIDEMIDLKGVENAIIALGGEIVLDPQNVEALQKIGALVFLRVKKNSDWQMVQEREPIYRSIPARCIDIDALDEAGVLAALKSILLLEDHPNGL